VGKIHKVDNNVKASLTFCAPIIRQIEISSSIAPNTANTAPAPTTTETDTHHNVRLAFGDMQEIPNLKLRNNIIGGFIELRKVTIRFVVSVCLSVRPHRSTRFPLDGFS